MTYNRHYQFVVSPNTTDRKLGASVTWPEVPTLALFLDSFTPFARSSLLHHAATHVRGVTVWILQKVMMKEADADLPGLLHLRAQLCVELPRKVPCRAQGLTRMLGRKRNGIRFQHILRPSCGALQRSQPWIIT